ncbi:MAG: tetratricopeptide repeat protein [Acidobacteria bacterium]|nr:tetratricopeptide repeat protein [Acidobacteriota bacterium]
MNPRRRRLRRFVPAALLALAAARPAVATTPAELFEGGNSAYEEGRLEQAAAAYEKILGYGIRDPRVHYNLANACFKMGRLGTAILHYEKARRLDPADPDIRDNLEYARGLIRDRVEAPEVPYPIRAIMAVVDPLSIDRMTSVFLAFYLLTGGLVGAIPLAQDPVRRKVLIYCALALGIGAAVAAGGLAYKIHATTAPHAVVMRDKADVLSGPGEDNTVLFTVHEGTLLEVRSRRGGWYQVSLPNALSGWIPAGTVEQV